jgi:putative spermidine/putrescine transport system permease protein
MAAAAIASSRPARSGHRGIVLALLLPGLLALAVTFVAPLIWLIRISFSPPGSGDIGSASLETYLSVVSDPFYWRLAWNTLVLGAIVALITVVLSYPLALFLARTESRFRGVLTALAIAPLLTSAIVRTYGWMVILSDQGVINGALRWMQIIDSPLRLMNNFLGAAIALVEILMPYGILAMLAGLGRLNPQLEDAARLLGANRWNVFRRIILPLSLPGVLTALLLVFVLAISSFVTPRLMGGGRVFVFGTEVFSEATVTLNWPLAAALSILLLILFGGVIVVYQRLIGALES